MKIKKIICLLLTLVMIMAVVSSCNKDVSTDTGTTQTAQKGDSTAEATDAEEVMGNGVAKGMEFPIVEEPTTLSAFVAYGSYTTGDFNDLAIWDVCEKLTNIKIDFDAYPMGDHEEKLSLILASNDLPDFFMKTTIASAQITKYADQGLFVPISPYLEDYAPNYYAQILKDPTLKAYATMGDGNVYGFTYLVPAAPAQTKPMFVNEKWLNALGAEIPTTTDGLLDLLKTVRDTDLNGNGEADEMGLVVTDFNHLLRVLMGSFGLGTRGYAAPYIDMEGSQLRYIPISDEYKELLMYLNTLYTEKLIPQEVFDMDITEVTALGEQNQVFMAFISIRDYLGETNKNDFIGIYEPFEGPDGDKMYALRRPGLFGQNTFITAENEYPEATMRWIDYFYSEPGVELYFMGIEDVTYVINAEGLPVYSDYVKNNPDGLNTEEVLGTYVPWSGGSNPSIAEDRCFGTNMYPALEQSITKALMAYTPEIVWGEFNYSSEDATKLTTLETDIKTYVDDMTAKFVAGTESFDGWDDYIATLERMGLDELMGIYQSGLDDYNSKLN